MGHDFTGKDIARIFKNEIGLMFCEIEDNNDQGIISLSEDIYADKFIGESLKQILAVMPYYQREYSAIKGNSVNDIYKALYAYIKAIIHVSIFDVDTKKIKSLYNSQEPKPMIPEMLLYPNELLCWKAIFIVHRIVSQSEHLSPFFSVEHCTDHREYSKSIFHEAMDGRLSEISVFLPEYLLRSLEPFHRLSTATLTYRLLGRDAFTLSLEKKCRDSESVGLIFMDIDYFKQFNDDWGHEAGDKCLIQIADVLFEICTCKKYKEYNGVAGRCGGEEFRLTFSDIDENGLNCIATDINEKLKLITREIKPENRHKYENIQPNMSASMGCGILPSLCDCNDSDMKNRLSAIYEFLDKEGVYKVKESGRGSHLCLDLMKF